jgi:POT family proton-dependent oligopeptide transporter
MFMAVLKECFALPFHALRIGHLLLSGLSRDSTPAPPDIEVAMADTHSDSDSLELQPINEPEEDRSSVSRNKREHRTSSTPSSLTQESVDRDHSYVSKSINLSDPQLGEEFPTPEERVLLRRVSDNIPWQSYLIAFIELAEQFSFYGCTVVFTNFIQQPLPPNSHTGAGGAHGQSGALGMGQRASTGLTNFNVFWVYITPIFSAFIADSYWGRYKTVCVMVAVALVGNALLIVSALPGVIDKPHTALAIFIVAVVVMGIGTGGLKSSTAPLIAEQYGKTRLIVREKAGERVLVDPAMTTSRIYMVIWL